MAPAAAARAGSVRAEVASREQQRQPERQQRRERVPVVQRPAEGPGPAGPQESAASVGAGKQARAQPGGSASAATMTIAAGERADRVPHGALAIAVDARRQHQDRRGSRRPARALEAALGAQRPRRGDRRPDHKAAEQRQRAPRGPAEPGGGKQPQRRADSTIHHTTTPAWLGRRCHSRRRRSPGRGRFRRQAARR